jgi:hypothetical protein
VFGIDGFLKYSCTGEKLYVVGKLTNLELCLSIIQLDKKAIEGTKCLIIRLRSLAIAVVAREH